jgi:hypothetical protein
MESVKRQMEIRQANDYKKVELSMTMPESSRSYGCPGSAKLLFESA